MAPDIKMNAGKQVGKDTKSFENGYTAVVTERVCGKKLTDITLAVYHDGEPLPFVYFDYGFDSGYDADLGYDVTGWTIMVPGAKPGFTFSSNHDAITSACTSRYMKHVLGEEDYQAVKKTVFLATLEWNALTAIADVNPDPEYFDDMVYGKDKAA